MLLCHLCEEPIGPRDEVHEDHIVPRSRGGTDDPSNLRLAHAICNLVKGNRVDLTVEQIRERRRSGVPLRRPQRRLKEGLTVYVPRAAKREAEERAAALFIAPATLLRQILLGQQRPLDGG